jgi:hypothetical protein
VHEDIDSAGKADLSKDREDLRFADSDLESGDQTPMNEYRILLTSATKPSDTKNKEHATRITAMKSIRAAFLNQVNQDTRERFFRDVLKLDPRNEDHATSMAAMKRIRSFNQCVSADPTTSSDRAKRKRRESTVHAEVTQNAAEITKLLRDPDAAPPRRRRFSPHRLPRAQQSRRL